MKCFTVNCAIFVLILYNYFIKKIATLARELITIKNFPRWLVSYPITTATSSCTVEKS